MANQVESKRHGKRGLNGSADANGSLSAQDALDLLDGLNADAPQPTSGGLKARVTVDLSDMICRALKMETEDLSPTKTWMDYGLDSIASTELTSTFEKKFGISVPPTIFFEFQNLDTFTDYLVANHNEALSSHYGDEEGPAEREATPAFAAPATPKVILTEPSRPTAPRQISVPVEPEVIMDRENSAPMSIEGLWEAAAVQDVTPSRTKRSKRIVRDRRDSDAVRERPQQGSFTAKSSTAKPSGKATVRRADLEKCQSAVEAAEVSTVVRADGRTVEYATYGSGAPLVLLGGLVMHFRVMWQLQLEAWGRNNTLIMPHMPGCGASTLADGLELDDLVEDVIAVLDEAGVSGPVTLLGYSFGGVLAQACALKYPERFSGLAICVSAAQDENTNDFAALMRELQKDPLFMEENRWWPMQALPVFERIVKGFDFRPQLKTLNIPTLVVAATDDDYMTVDHSRQIANALPNPELVVFDDVGHLFGFTKFETFNQTISDFVRNLPLGHADVGRSPLKSGHSDYAAASEQTLAMLRDYVERSEAGHTIMLPPTAAQAAYLLNCFIDQSIDKAGRYNTYFLTSLDEAIDSAMRLCRHVSRNANPKTSGHLVVVDPSGDLSDRFAPLGATSGRPLVEGISWHTQATDAEDYLEQEPQSPSAVIAVITEATQPEQMRQLAEQTHGCGALFVLVDNREQALDAADNFWKDIGTPPDVIVFGDTISNFQVPSGCVLVKGGLPNPWMMTPNEGYVRHPMANLGFAQRIIFETLFDKIEIGAVDHRQLRVIETSPKANLEAHIAFGNAGYARVAKVHGFDGQFSEAQGACSRLRLPGEAPRPIVDFLSNVGTSPRGTNPRDVSELVAGTHDPEIDYWQELSNQLSAQTNLNELLPASSYVTAIDKAISLAILARPEKRKIVTFSGAAGFSLIAGAIAKDTFFDSFRAPFQPLFSDTVFIDPAAADAAEQLEQELAAGDVAMVWLEPLQIEGNAARALPTNLIDIAMRLRDQGDYLVAVDETQSALWTGRLLHSDGLIENPDIVVLGTALTDSLLPIGGTLATSEVVEAAARSNLTALQRLQSTQRCQLSAHLAVNSLNASLQPEFLKAIEENGAYLAQKLNALAAKYPLLGRVRAEGLLQILELDVSGLPQFVQQSFGYLFWGHMLRDPEGGAAVVVCPLHNNCLRLAPPLNVTQAEIDQFVATFERSLAKGAASVIEDCAAYCKSRGDNRTSTFFSQRAAEVWQMDTLNAKPFQQSSRSGAPGSAVRFSGQQPGRKPRVCVIGSGVGGISAIKALNDKDIPFDCYEARDQIGGIWAFDDAKKSTSTWKNLNMNTPKGYYQFEDAPMPEEYPDYPARQQVQDYLLNYIDSHGLRDRIHLNSPVKHASQRADNTWDITLGNGRTVHYDALVVANGHHNTPSYPEYAKRDTFDGDAIHSMHYRTRHAYKDKRVLVVGVGNSGSQVAVDVSHDASMTYVALRRGVYILPHYLLGMRVDKAMGPLNAWWVKKMMPYPLHGVMMTAIYKLVVAKHKQMGMPRPDHWMLSCLPTMSENFGNRIGDGKLKIVGDIDRIDGKLVTFKDGSELEVDSIIYSTGFKTDFKFFDEDFLKVEDNRIPFFKRIFQPDIENLAFVGCFQAIDWGFLPIMEKQAKIVASYFAGEYALPAAEVQKNDIAREQKLISREFLHSLRNNYYLHGPTFQRELRIELKKGQRRARRGKGATFFSKQKTKDSEAVMQSELATNA